MPKLLFFAPCEKVIIDETSKTLSLVTVLEQVTGEMPANATTNDKVTAALNWYAVAVWLKTPDDIGKTYEQRTCVIQPNGDETLAGTAEFQISMRTHRTLARIFGFPINQTGEHIVRLALREQNGQWVTMAEYPIRVIHRGDNKNE